jgi:hypothetical protein
LWVDAQCVAPVPADPSKWCYTSAPTPQIQNNFTKACKGTWVDDGNGNCPCACTLQWGTMNMGTQNVSICADAPPGLPAAAFCN